MTGAGECSFLSADSSSTTPFLLLHLPHLLLTFSSRAVDTVAQHYRFLLPATAVAVTRSHRPISQCVYLAPLMKTRSYSVHSRKRNLLRVETGFRSFEPLGGLCTDGVSDSVRVFKSDVDSIRKPPAYAIPREEAKAGQGSHSSSPAQLQKTDSRE
jgi:hypothetical protein